MKKYLRPLGLVLAFAMLTAGAYAAASGDSLISLRYLQDTFFPKAVQTGEETAARLAEMGFALRGGLHCAPLAHRKMGTLDRGTVRAGIGYFNTGEQVDALAGAVEKLARRR